MTGSAAFELSDRVVTRLGADDPCLAAILGLPSDVDRLTDYSPDACAARADTARSQFAEAREVPIVDDADRIARDVMVERLENTVAMADAGEYLRDLNILFSPPQTMRMALELPGAEPGAVLGRLSDLPTALAGWRASLDEGSRQGITAARRQAVAVAEQLGAYAQSWLPGFVAEQGASPELVAAGENAARACRDTATWLADVYAGRARAEDAVGEEAYLRFSRYFNGIDLDLDETFSWGWQEISRLTQELRTEADRLAPGIPLTELRARLDDDPVYRIEGVEALTRHLERLTATATDAVDGLLFDIDPRVRQCEVRIAAEGSAAAPYYVSPSEDLSRPGSTWYPTRGMERFPRWWLESVWYHEGVPGHHLQVGATATQDALSRFQRTLGMTSGHAEGWALYAERLSDELGWFDEPGTRIGFLSSQLMRAVRVVVDIGMHTGRTVPRGFPHAGAHVDARMARRLLEERALLEPGFAASEVDRYLGIPAQAISYKVGEREWLAARDEARQAQGPGFDLKAWHMAGIRLGPMGLAPFRSEMATHSR